MLLTIAGMVAMALLAQEGATPQNPPPVPVPAAPKLESKLETMGKYLVAGQKAKLFASLAAPGAAQAIDSVEIHSKAGEKPVQLLQLDSGAVVEASSNGGQKRNGEIRVPPDLPAGPAELFWKCGEQVIGPASVEILRLIRDVDWEKAEIASVEKAAVLIETDFGQMIVYFYPDIAPNTVRNFLKLAGSGFYDGLTFHRVRKDFMIQGGDPKGDGSGDPGFKIKAEFSDAKHVKGVISMARKSDPDSASCQFFIVHKDTSALDGQYTAFGKLDDGFETLDRIANIPCDKNSRGEVSKPRQKVLMRKVIVVEKRVIQ